MKRSIVLMLACGACFAQSTDRTVKLKAVHTIFISGNNQAAEKMRDELEKGKTCFALSLKAASSDATLDVASDSQLGGGSLGVRDWVVSGNLTNADGELLWSRSMRFSDAPFSNGGKTAGKALLNELSRQVCAKK
jgi:hypothetical protein